MSDLQCAARLLLVRPGEAEFEDGDHERSGGSLSLSGRKQARGIVDSVHDARVSVIYSSPASRAVQTAEIVAAGLGVIVRVREQLAGSEGLAEELSGAVDLHRGETVLVVTHDRAIRAAVPPLALNLPDDYGDAHGVEPAGIVAVDADADGWVVRSWADEPV